MYVGSLHMAGACQATGSVTAAWGQHISLICTDKLAAQWPLQGPVTPARENLAGAHLVKAGLVLTLSTVAMKHERMTARSVQGLTMHQSAYAPGISQPVHEV